MVVAFIVTWFFAFTEDQLDGKEWPELSQAPLPGSSPVSPLPSVRISVRRGFLAAGVLPGP